MRPDDLYTYTRRQPFQPFRIIVRDGRAFEIRHWDRLLVLQSRVVIGVGDDDDVPDYLEHVALAHVTRLEELVGSNDC